MSLESRPSTSIEIFTFSDISLKQFTPEDSQEIYELINSNRDFLSRFGENTGKKYFSVDEVEESIVNPTNPHRLRFAIRDQKDNLVGSINLTRQEEDHSKAEVGYYLGKNFSGYGYMIKAVGAISNYAFDNGYDYLFALVHEDNIPSINVLRRSGYIENGKNGQTVSFVRVKE